MESVPELPPRESARGMSASADYFDPPPVLDDAERASFISSIEHIELLAEKRRRLEQAQVEAEIQFVHRLGVEHRAGRVPIQVMADAYDRIRAAGLPHYSTRWRAATGLHPSTMARRLSEGWLGNAGLGIWRGEVPIGKAAAPQGGVCVVYVLYDHDANPCYVGSTMHFRDRLKAHRKSGKPVHWWTAYQCADREAAYIKEDQLLKEHKPYLNKRAGR